MTMTTTIERSAPAELERIPAPPPPADPVDEVAQVLDKIAPGWALQVSLEQLNLADAKRCICGQVFGSYLEGLARLGPHLGSFHGWVAAVNGGSNYEERWAQEVRARL